MIGKNIDLILAVAWTVGTVSVVLLVPSLEVLRIVLGVPFVLLLPGYCLVAALYPRRNDLEGLERLALSFALSIAVVPLIALALNYSPWGVRLTPILAFVAVFIVLAAVAAAGRRWMLPTEQAFVVTGGVRLPRRLKLRVRPIDGVVALALTALLAGLGGVVYFVGTSAEDSEGYTEFYVLGPEGKAEGYPGVVKAGEEATAVLGLVNHEGQDTAYRIAVRLDDKNADDIDGLVLGDGERWEEATALVPTRVGNDQKAEFLLYKDGGDEPYRSLHLWLNVEATPTKTARPSPTPTRAPTVTSPPEAAISIGSAGLFYVVQPGDTLTAIGDRFGLDPEAIAAVNGMDEPEPVLAGEELRIPGVVYSVQAGDTLADIAVAFGVPLAAIMAANAIADADAISGGQRLAIPGGGVALPMVQTPKATPKPSPKPSLTPSSTSAVTPIPSPRAAP
jgi:uncharacterized membrane protein/LysM repeat protein